MTIYFNSGTRGFDWLSNFYMARIEVGDTGFWPSAEHAYQAAKTLIPLSREQIRNAATARDAKRLGKWATLRPEWDAMKDDIMRVILLCKYTQHADLLDKLRETGEQRLVHLSPWDKYWGVDHNGIGRNKLGNILMEVRAELRERAYV